MFRLIVDICIANIIEHPKHCLAVLLLPSFLSRLSKIGTYRYLTTIPGIMSISSLNSVFGVDEDSSVPRSQNCPRIDLHLNSPILSVMNTLFIDAVKLYPKTSYDPGMSTTDVSYVRLPSAVSKPVGSLLSICGGKNKFLDKLNNNIYEFVHHVFAYTYTPQTISNKWLPNKSTLLSDVLMNIIRAYDERLINEFSPGESVTFTDQESSIYSVKMVLEDIRDLICRKAENKSDEWSLVPFPSSVYKALLVSRSMTIVMKTHKSVSMQHTATYSTMTKVLSDCTSVYLCNYEHLLCILDTMIGRLYSMYSHRLLHDKFLFKVPTSQLTDIYRCFDAGLITHGNQTYNQIKNFESLVFSIIIQKNDVTNIKNEFHEYLIKSSREDGFELIDKMDSLLQELNVYQLAEIFGIYRHWGHPIVDEVAGCRKVQDIIKTRRVADREALDEINGNLVKQLVVEFISQHNRWPHCDTSRLDPDSPLINLVRSNDRNLNDYEMNIPMSQWAKLRVISELEMDYHIDYTDLLNDKAIAPLASENQSTYHNQMSGITTEKPTTTRRVLSEIMQRTKLSVKEICLMIMSRQIPRDWWIIKLSPKEREVNIKPRLFAMMVLEMRLYFCVIESNISKKVFKYFPQQSMTLDEEKLSRRLINMSSTRNASQYLEVTVGVDFKSWNIHWSMFNTQDTAVLLDDWFGTPGLFTFGHQFFSGSEVSLSSKFLIPEKYMSKEHSHRVLDADLYCWNNHLGGLEGIMQKMWTLITIGILLVVESRTGIKSTIIGQGDNQVCKLRIPVTDDTVTDQRQLLLKHQNVIRTAKAKFLETLGDISDRIGIELKPLESWASDSTMIYSKEIYINGANASQLMKRESRTMADPNDDYPTCGVRLGTIQSSGYSAAQKSYVMAIPWLVSQVETGLTLLRDVRVASKLSKQKELMNQILNVLETKPALTFFFLTNVEFTGIPLLSLLEYEFRGHPDPFTTYTTLLSILSTSTAGTDKIREIATKIRVWLHRGLYKLGSGSSELLVCNPTATNIWTPTPLSRTFKDEVFHFISTNSKNKDIKELFNATTKDYDDSFFKYLTTSTPLYPRLLNVIATHSPTGSRLYMISKFTNTKTVQAMSQGGVKFGSTTMIQQSDTEFYKHIMTLYISILKVSDYNQDELICPTLLADRVRHHSFRELLNGRKIIGVTMPHPAHILKIRYDDLSESDQYISIFAPNKFRFDNLLEAGNQPAFVGTKTREKTSGKIVTISGRSRPFDDACRLKRVQQWAVDPDSPMYNFIDNLITCRTNVPHDVIGSMSGVSYFGSHIHRVGDAATKKETKNNLRHSVTTWFALSSDKLGLTARGGDDFNIQVSGLYHFLIRDIIKHCVHDTSYEFYYMRGYRTNDCCHEAYDNAPTSTDALGPMPAINNNNPLLYADILEFQKLVTVQSSLVEYDAHISASDAVGYYMMSRFKGITSQSIVTSQGVKAPYVTRLSMSEVLNIGLSSLIKSFAKYLYLYIGDKYSVTRVLLSDMQSDLWCGLAELCLMPTILEQLVCLLRIDGVENCYKTSNKITKLLNELLIKEMDRIHELPNKHTVYYSVKFFLLTNVKFASIFLMWWFYIKLMIHIDDKYYKEVKYYMLGTSRVVQDWNDTMRIALASICSSDQSRTLWSAITTSHKIRMMKHPPEYYFKNPDYLPQTIETPITLPAARYINHETVSSIACSEYPVPKVAFVCRMAQINKPIPVSELYISPDSIELIPKSRTDQIGRLYGTLSTAYLKYMQIVIKENIVFDNDIICTADGEAGLAHALSVYSGRNIYYNSLQSRDIQTQRYESFVPGSFLLARDKIKSHQHSLIYGGDLTDDVYLTRFIETLPQNAALMTCDANISGLHDLDTRVKLIVALIKIVNHRYPQALIVKIYLDNPLMIAAEISIWRNYYIDVSLITPVCSSNENRECFLVCRVLRVGIDSIVCPEGFLILEEDYMKYLRYLRSYQSVRTGSIYPYAWTHKQTLLSLLSLGEQLGYHSNLSHNLFLLTCTMPPNNLRPGDVKEWLTVCTKSKRQNIQTIVTSFAMLSSDRGNKIPWSSTLGLSMSPSISITLERDTTALICCQVLSAVLDQPNLEEAKNSYLSAIRTLPNKVKIQGRTVFDYTLHDIVRWESRFLKPLWRVWGHVNFK